MGRLAAMVLGCGMAGAGLAQAQVIEGSESSSEGMEVMTRGPVHEAFAETVTFDPQPGNIVPKQPPALIEELVPDQRPTGDNVTWIPGYWGWDEEQSNFLWISGIWRNLPPGREWVPGYWSQVDTGHQWTSGYWQDAEAEEVTYLPEPPRSVEQGPSVAAASDEEMWIPGNWEYRQDRYAWRAGYWVAARPNWSWTPSYYRWTSYGYVYVDGYWDYPVVNRGVVFAPVRFHNNYYARPGYCYSPLAAISLSVFSNHLFVRPGYGHYYYGDYYEPRYRDRYYASCHYGSRYRGYDPIYSYQRWENRGNRNWGRERQDYYEHRRDHVGSRPPRTWAAMNSRGEGVRQRGDFRVVERYDRMVSSRNTDGRRFQSVSNEERQRFVSQRNEVRNFGRERQNREVDAARVRGDRQDRTEASRMKVSRSPVVSQRSDRSGQKGGPPARLQQRTSERRAIANNEGRNDNAPKAGRRDPATAERGQADNRGRNGGGNPLANTMASPNRESRTTPGQRRDPAASSKGKSQQTAEANGRANNRSGGRTELDRKVTSSAVPKGKTEPRRDATPSGRNQGRPQVGNDRGPTEKRAANSSVPQRMETPTPRREAAPQAQRKSARPEVSKPAIRQATPSRKVTTAPSRQPNRNAAPQRAEARPQPKAQPQRQQSPRPAQRQSQPAPQRQKAAPAARQEPQRPRAQPAPQRQAARPEPQRQRAQPAPQRQTARPEPQRQRAQPAAQRQTARPTPQQPQRAAARPQTTARTNAATESNPENKRKRQN